ncbi:MAG TPA: response regulator [Candidatus Limnocylindria bacterium]|nr:response regulator [Candidatus Limnocylindria bacterium]
MIQRPRVLVVEDDADTLAAMATILRETDAFSVWVARSGDQALEVADEIGFNADVVVLDIDLGPAMRGDQFAEEYRQRAGRPTPFVVVSGLPHARDIARAIGAALTLPKPFEADELVNAVRLLVS